MHKLLCSKNLLYTKQFLLKFAEIFLNKFMWLSGFMHDGKAVIKVLCHRNATQRKLIRKTYQELYNQDLIDTLQSKISHNFGVCSLLTSSKHMESSLCQYILIPKFAIS